LLVIVSIRFKTIHDVFATENKKVCFHDSLLGIMEREYPTHVDSFNKSNVNDTQRLQYLQSNDQCDGVVISRYSLSFISTQIKSSCNKLYPLYDEDLFSQEVIVPISQTLGALGDELVRVMDIMASKNLYRIRHDDIVSSLDEGCEFRVLNYQNGVLWEVFSAPLIFSVVLVVIAFTVGCMKYKNRQKSMQNESNSPQVIAEQEEELVSLLDDDDDLNRFSNVVKQLNQESEERLMERIVLNVESNIMKRVERTVEQVTYDNKCLLKQITDDNERVIKQITNDNEGVIKETRDLRSRINNFLYSRDQGENVLCEQK